MKLTVVFEGKGIASFDNSSLFDVVVAKNEQGTLFYSALGSPFEPIDSYDLRIVNGKKYLVNTQPSVQDMPIT